MITYKASGIVLGNYWGSGTGDYPSEKLTANSREELDKQINAGIKDGSLDSGMGFELLIGALMIIETIDSRYIDSKHFEARSCREEVYGKLSKEQIDFLSEVLRCS